MRAPRRRIATAVPLVLAALLCGCTVSIVDPSEDSAASSSRQDSASASPDRAPTGTPTSSTADDTASDDPDAPPADADSSDLSPAAAAERERLIAAATTTMPCPSGPLDQDGAIIRVEGPCASLVIDIDAGVVIADDVDELLLRGSGSVVYAGIIGTATVSGSANEVYWSGRTPRVEDSGTANTLGRG